MRRKAIFTNIFVIITALLLSSCTGGDIMGRSYYFDNDEEMAEKTLTQITQAISNRNKAALKALFSKRALAEAEDFDADLNNFFEIFQDKNLSWEDNVGPVVTMTNDYGAKTKQYEMWNNVNSENQQYLFYFIEWVIDTENPDNLGLYTLRIMRKEDEDIQFTRDTEKEIPGIYYKPEEKL